MQATTCLLHSFKAFLFLSETLPINHNTCYSDNSHDPVATSSLHPLQGTQVADVFVFGVIRCNHKKQKKILPCWRAKSHVSDNSAGREICWLMDSDQVRLFLGSIVLFSMISLISVYDLDAVRLIDLKFLRA